MAKIANHYYCKCINFADTLHENNINKGGKILSFNIKILISKFNLFLPHDFCNFMTKSFGNDGTQFKESNFFRLKTQ